MNLHTHTTYCDGTAHPSDFILKAKQLSWDFLGFSAHAPLPFPCEWSIKESELPNYTSEIHQLAEMHKSEIKIHSSFEIDFLDGLGFPSLKFEEIKKSTYLITSIHFVSNPKAYELKYLEIDGTYSQFLLALKSYDFDLKKLLQSFLGATEQMLSTPIGCVKIIGHIDKIILNASKTSEFLEFENWFYDELFQIALNSTSQFDFIEINTRAMYKKGLSNPYPKLEFIAKLHQNNIPLIINSDAHHPSELDGGYRNLHQLLTQCGLKDIEKTKMKL